MVVGGIPSRGFEQVHYTMPPSARWFENRTRAYAKGCARIIDTANAKLAEIHNRPHLLRLIAQKTDRPLALHLHNDPQEMDEARTPKERLKLLGLCSAIYCVSNYIRDRFMDGLPKNAGQKLSVIYNGIEIPQELPQKENIIVFAGRMTEGKGALLLAQALRVALPQLPGWRAILIGSRRHEAGRSLTPHEKEIAAMLKPLETQVAVTGFLAHEETLSHFSRAAIAVVPSLWEEPFGRTALEAMAYGCAVISSGRGGLREVTADAALSPPQMTEETLAHAILLLGRDEDLRASYTRLARERAQYFAIDARTAALDEVRSSLLAKSVKYDDNQTHA